MLQTLQDTTSAPRHWISERRDELSLSREALARKLTAHGLDVTAQDIHTWEGEEAALPLEQPAFAFALAAALHLDIRALLRRAGYKHPLDNQSLPAQAARIVARLPQDQQKLAIHLLKSLHNDDWT